MARERERGMSETKVSERDTIKQRVIKLLALTTDRGASEHEAMLAAEKAAELMVHYDIEASELNLKPPKAVMETVVCRKYGSMTIGGPIARHAAQLCDCDTNLDPQDADLPEVWQRTLKTVVFFGMPSDAEVAAYLFDLISNAIVAEIEVYKAGTDYQREIGAGVNGRTAITSFVAGMEARINERLDEMRAQRHQAVQEATGRALVVVKETQIKEDFAATGIKLTRGGGSYRGRGSASANASGRAAGGRVSLSRGVGAGRSTGALR